MAPRQVAALLGVAKQLRDGCSRHVFVQDNHLTAGVERRSKGAVIRMVGDEDQTIHLIAAHRLQVGKLTFPSVQGRMQCQSQPAPVRLGFDGCDKGRKERCGDVGNDKPDRIRPAAAQPAGVWVGLVVQL